MLVKVHIPSVQPHHGVVAVLGRRRTVLVALVEFGRAHHVGNSRVHTVLHVQLDAGHPAPRVQSLEQRHIVVEATRDRRRRGARSQLFVVACRQPNGINYRIFAMNQSSVNCSSK